MIIHRRVIAAFTLLALASGCGGSATTGPLPYRNAQPTQPLSLQMPALFPDAGKKIWVVSRNSAAILGYPAAASGNVRPSVVISGSNTQLSEPDAFSVAPNGDLYAANDSANTVLIFAKGSHGNATPQVLGGSKSPLADTEGVAVDKSGNIYVSDYEDDQIVIWKKGATGNVKPERVIVGAKTKLATPCGMAIDSKGHLWVANKNSSTDPVVEFGATANGNVAPIHTLGGSNSGLSGVFDLTVDPNDRVIASDEYGSAVDVFKAGAHGNATPVQVISGSNTLITAAVTVGTDSTGKIYVTNYSSPESILVFAKNANGNVAPLANISGSRTKMDFVLYPNVY